MLTVPATTVKPSVQVSHWSVEPETHAVQSATVHVLLSCTHCGERGGSTGGKCERTIDSAASSPLRPAHAGQPPGALLPQSPHSVARVVKGVPRVAGRAAVWVGRRPVAHALAGHAVGHADEGIKARGASVVGGAEALNLRWRRRQVALGERLRGCGASGLAQAGAQAGLASSRPPRHGLLTGKKPAMQVRQSAGSVALQGPAHRGSNVEQKSAVAHCGQGDRAQWVRRSWLA